ncbi:hypothetical protein HMPREF9372_1912 [Sporosarcina newyorkensis 2681]|uniref:Uncharacterized protein n=1 Tax=Sporosarcina newyorkensis 2681 TaxID=1027292 RepID=F9DSY1_9BACL|nr:hypothetical protein [Sporosarcina newyorkensis]EGQ26045.1 hypothetical protein HMPREF9372_1912 [Sporosarcina newyorkensis 2681]
MQKSLVFLLGSIAFLTALFIVLGFVFDKDENQKQNGLTEVYDVSSDGEIAYVVYEKGQANLYLTLQEQPLLQLPIEKEIVDLTFSEDGKRLAFAIINKDREQDAETDIHVVRLDSLGDEHILSVDSLITEVAFDPKNPELLFYLQAAKFTNYSPVAAKHPHDFDVHSYHLKEQTYTKYTDMKKYNMASLQVSSEKESVFVQMDDDDDVQSADDVFSSSQRIFEIPLDEPDEKSIISSAFQAEDIYDFTLVPERQEIIYQAVAGTGENGIFEYELFVFNWKTYQTEQLTSLKEHASKPVLGPDEKIYFMVNRNFAGRSPDYHLYRMNMDGRNVEKVPLEAAVK